MKSVWKDNQRESGGKEREEEREREREREGGGQTEKAVAEK